MNRLILKWFHFVVYFSVSQSYEEDNADIVSNSKTIVIFNLTLEHEKI